MNEIDPRAQVRLIALLDVHTQEKAPHLAGMVDEAHISFVVSSNGDGCVVRVYGAEADHPPVLLMDVDGARVGLAPVAGEIVYVDE